MKAVILAAGEGKRMHPLTHTRPKAMVYAAGKPLLWHVLHEVKKAGVNEAIIIVKYKKEKILEYFAANDLGMKLEFVEQGDKYGTGAAVLAAKGRVQGSFLVIAGDLVTESAVIKKVMQAHEGGVTAAAKAVDNPKHYGIFEVKDGRIAAVEEKPEAPKGNLANISIYMMDEGVFPLLEAITPSLRGEYEITDILRGGKCVQADGF
ncbi:Bifunctional protein GlmU [uncultured archaeon]|nr:Bifunctional protein GlmU [uncultured archaeon]